MNKGFRALSFVKEIPNVMFVHAVAVQCYSAHGSRERREGDGRTMSPFATSPEPVSINEKLSLQKAVAFSSWGYFGCRSPRRSSTIPCDLCD